MQVRHASQLLSAPAQARDEVGEVRAVLLDLVDRVQPLTDAIEVDHIVGTVDHRGLRPLLELNDHIRRFARLRVVPAHHNICTLTGQRESILDEHFGVVEASVFEIADEHAQAALPRAHLSLRRVVTELVEELFSQGGYELVGGDLAAHARHRTPIQRHCGSRKTRRTSRPGWSLVSVTRLSGRGG